jgi:gluconate 5-dehydrogenase
MASHPMFDVAGRTALVTGSRRGIGRALARGLLEAGCTVVLNGRDAAQLEVAKAELTALAAKSGGAVHAVAFDNADPAAVVEGVRRAEELAGPLEIAVCNTGAQHRQPFLEFEDAEWFRLLDTNLTSTFLVAREVGRRMAPRGRGKIVTVCSLQSEVSRPGIAPYAATKGALKMLTKGMCADLAGVGIQVNGLGPGYVETELTAALVADPEFSQWVRGRTPAGRWGQVGDLIGALLFLVSPASDFVNGQVIYVDGGMLAVL